MEKADADFYLSVNGVKFQIFSFNIWLLCSITVDNLINRMTNYAMSIIYNNENEEEFEALLEQDGTLKIHKRNLQKLMVEIYKMINHLNCPYMRGFFTKKLVELPHVRLQRFGTNALKFKESILWNILNDDIKTIFRQKLKA